MDSETTANVVPSVKSDPAVVDLEQEFINHLATQDSLEFILREGVTNDLLIAPRTKSVFQFVQHHFNETGKIANVKVLNTEFPHLTFDEPESTIQWLIDKLRQRYQSNKISELTLNLAGKVEQPEEAMNYLRREFITIEHNSLSQAQIARPGDHKIFIRELQQKVLAGHFQGVSIGFDEIDKFTGGVKNGNVAYILARPKRKKTFMTLAAFIAQVIADQEPYLHTLENTKDEVMLRISCMLSGVSWDLAQKGQLMPADYKRINQAWEQFSEHKFHIEQPPLEERSVPALLLKADKVNAGPVLISQFKYITGLKDFYRHEFEEKAEIAVDLKRAAIRPGKERPIIIEAQFNRGGDSMEELEDFDASKVGLTDMIPQSADTLYGIFESKDMRANNTFEYGILEARNHDKAAWDIFGELRMKTEFRLMSGSQH
jgi:hypothetical protein